MLLLEDTTSEEIILLCATLVCTQDWLVAKQFPSEHIIVSPTSAAALRSRLWGSRIFHISVDANEHTAGPYIMLSLLITDAI